MTDQKPCEGCGKEAARAQTIFGFLCYKCREEISRISYFALKVVIAAQKLLMNEDYELDHHWTCESTHCTGLPCNCGLSDRQRDYGSWMGLLSMEPGMHKWIDDELQSSKEPDYDVLEFPVIEGNDEYLYIDVAGKGTIQIKSQENGIVVDIFPLNVVDEPVASTWADIGELIYQEDDDD